MYTAVYIYMEGFGMNARSNYHRCNLQAVENIKGGGINAANCMDELTCEWTPLASRGTSYDRVGLARGVGPAPRTSFARLGKEDRQEPVFRATPLRSHDEWAD